MVRCQGDMTVGCYRVLGQVLPSLSSRGEENLIFAGPWSLLVAVKAASKSSSSSIGSMQHRWESESTSGGKSDPGPEIKAPSEFWILSGISQDLCKSSLDGVKCWDIIFRLLHSVTTEIELELAFLCCLSHCRVLSFSWWIHFTIMSPMPGKNSVNPMEVHLIYTSMGIPLPELLLISFLSTQWHFNCPTFSNISLNFQDCMFSS